ncbi:flagellin lysine-N-methylase [Candidatus Sodalis sp. SoCistrobi]|uniref:flagellin lysine-N-methylase n=1 Tax=Candidatus Sodalis sp. SoCistrobi TaxID=1922216 RepID=UPI00093A4781|nr:flagellin lysine-N-methylase [Candidatus Sodalis sp. SoCistrobi]
MKLHREITPVFYRNFKCRGEQCLSHCCRGWTINIDKKTQKTYKSAHQIEVKDITEKYLIPHRSEQHTQHYAYIALKQDGDCPFLNPKKLCNIYLTLGPNALSRTCQTYQRIETSLQSYRQHSLSLSCPEAVRLVLFDPDALKYEEKTTVKRTKITESVGSTRRDEVTQEQQIIQLFCRHLIMAHSPFIEDNLYALVQFMIFLQSLNYRVEENYPRVESLFTTLVKELTDGQIESPRIN